MTCAWSGNTGGGVCGLLPCSLLRGIRISQSARVSLSSLWTSFHQWCRWRHYMNMLQQLHRMVKSCVTICFTKISSIVTDFSAQTFCELWMFFMFTFVFIKSRSQIWKYKKIEIWSEPGEVGCRIRGRLFLDAVQYKLHRSSLTSRLFDLNWRLAAGVHS